MVRRHYSTQNTDISSDSRQRSNLDATRYVQAELFTSVEADTSGDSCASDACSMEKRSEDAVPLGYIEHLASALVRYIDWRDGQVRMRQAQRDKAMATRRRNQELRRAHGAGDYGVVDVPETKRSWGVCANDWSAILKDLEA